MPVDTTSLYEPMISRDVAGIRTTISKSEGTPRELGEAVARFAVLAFCPSEHSKASLQSAAAMLSILEVVSDPVALITECAIYSAESRAPWSEPPILDAPADDLPAEPTEGVLAAAIEARDRLAGERWLARLLQETDGAARFTTIAERFEDPSAVSIAAAARRVAAVFPPQYTFACLRTAVDAWVNNGATLLEKAVGRETTLADLAAEFEREQGSPLVFQRLAKFDALAAVGAGATEADLFVTGTITTPNQLPEPSYRLARDYGAYLQAWAIRHRLRGRYADDVLTRIAAAAWDNLRQGDSFDAWSHA